MKKETSPVIVTLGCRLNLYESELMRALAASAGLENVVIVNSCAVTGLAERQTRQAIRRVRRAHPQARIIVTGCAAHINPELYAAMPEVDEVIGNEEKLKAETFCRLAARSLPANKGDTLVKDFSGGLTRGFVPVQVGCDHACTYCIIPQGRGKARSLPPERIVSQARKLVENGYPEIVLTGVDIASYGKNDMSNKTLGGLVQFILQEIPELTRLRLSSLDPACLDEDLWSLIAGEPRLMPHVHLSVQSGDDLILKRMKRRHTRKDVFALVRRARSLRPDMAFGADVIAGFPTEDGTMFENTCTMLEELDITWVHVFPYSARKGTPAARMPQVKNAVRTQRAARLRALREKAVEKHLKSLVGKTLALHIEQPFLGRAPDFSEVVLTAPKKTGEVVNITITGVERGRALGRTVE